MAGTFPLDPPANYTHSIQIRMSIIRSANGKEQRAALSKALNSFSFNFSRLTLTEVNSFVTFFNAQKGRFDRTWSGNFLDPATKAARAYLKMGFATDDVQITESKIGQFQMNVSFGQDEGDAVTISSGGAFPSLSNGARVQLPFGTSNTWATSSVGLDSGKQINWYTRDSPLRKWSLDFGLITDNELQSYVVHYLNQCGPLYGFPFTDPNPNATYTNVRYSDAPLVITRISPDMNRLTLSLEQYPV
jgi:hypothetical protein